MSQAVRVASALMDIEYQLRQTHLWETTAPTQEALSSTLPFCVDTLAFNQWLQFVLLPAFAQLLNTESELPKACNILSMAEEQYKSQKELMQGLLDAIKALDEAITLIDE